MKDTITIPPEALEAAARAVCRERCAFFGEPPCFEVGEGFSPLCDEPGCVAEAHAACLAMLAAWPGMAHFRSSDALGYPRIILPLPQENSNDKA